MHKIGVIGDYESIKSFAAIGLSIFPANHHTEASSTIKKLATDEYAIIYITEDLMELMQSDLKKYKEQLLPAIIPIPGVKAKNGFGMQNIRNMAVKAIGSDIVFNTD